jgi:hypothetical protein
MEQNLKQKGIKNIPSWGMMRCGPGCNETTGLSIMISARVIEMPTAWEHFHGYFMRIKITRANKWNGFSMKVTAWRKFRWAKSDFNIWHLFVPKDTSLLLHSTPNDFKIREKKYTRHQRFLLVVSNSKSVRFNLIFWFSYPDIFSLELYWNQSP